ncbi:hypothetical protein FOFC_14858 [Fusarium oxysporum]|nr:hypothetical protein FOFC_14858 [Fusarium oxysporum]
MSQWDGLAYPSLKCTVKLITMCMVTRRPRILCRAGYMLQAVDPGSRHNLRVIVGIHSFIPSFFFHPTAPPITPRLWRETYLTEESSAAGLDSLDLSGVEGSAVEASRELRDVKGNALRGLDGAKGGSGGSAEARLLERTVLLDVVAVGAERLVGGSSIAVSVAGPGLGELLDSGGRVRLGGVVDVGCRRRC